MRFIVLLLILFPLIAHATTAATRCQPSLAETIQLQDKKNEEGRVLSLTNGNVRSTVFQAVQMPEAVRGLKKQFDELEEWRSFFLIFQSRLTRWVESRNQLSIQLLSQVRRLDELTQAANEYGFFSEYAGIPQFVATRNALRFSYQKLNRIFQKWRTSLVQWQGEKAVAEMGAALIRVHDILNDPENQISVWKKLESDPEEGLTVNLPEESLRYRVRMLAVPGTRKRQVQVIRMVQVGAAVEIWSRTFALPRARLGDLQGIQLVFGRKIEVQFESVNFLLDLISGSVETL